MKNFLILLFILLISGIFYTHLPQKLYDRFILDNYNHYVSCDELPNTEVTQQVFSENKEEISQLIQATSKDNSKPVWQDMYSVQDESGSILIFISKPKYCSSLENTDIEIMYGSHEQKIIIETYLKEMKFHTIPVRLRNV